MGTYIPYIPTEVGLRVWGFEAYVRGWDGDCRRDGSFILSALGLRICGDRFSSLDPYIPPVSISLSMLFSI